MLLEIILNIYSYDVFARSLLRPIVILRRCTVVQVF